ncbi:MAG: hypothetical protein S4CHLAM2_06410 [Chlamydiales bacterium]|nr:hypothetical protein [Chlamydiales bacterium]
MERYAQQIKLAGFGEEKQEVLKRGKVLVVGAGGLGCAVLQTLTAMGVGTLGIADGDSVSLSNLSRQVLYTPEDVGKPKNCSARARLRQQNPDVLIETYEWLTSENALRTIQSYQLVVDASDNFTTRYLINDVCVSLGLPFVVGAVDAFSGHVSTFNWQGSPTYRDLFPTLCYCNSCEVQGVLGVLPNLIGQLQALEVIKIITGLDTPLAGQLLCFDGKTFKTVTYSKQEFSVVKTIAYSELETLHEYQLVDVRTVEEREAFHIGGMHPLDMDKLDPSKPIVVYCRRGVRSLKVAKQIEKKWPASEVYSLEGGVEHLRQKSG